VVLLYARMGGEADEVFFDGESVGIAGNMPEDPLASRDYLFDLDDFGPGKHTIQIVGQEVTPCDTGQTCRDGFSDGYHFIDALRLSGTAKEDIPGITGSIDPEPNANGWNNTNVTISFETDIDPSEIDSITPDIDVMTEGEGQVFTGTVVDTSGGSNSVDVIVNLDKTAPDVAIVLPGEGVPVVVPEVTVTGDVSDGLSGVDSVTCNGVVAEVEDSTFICGVPVDEGDNTITVMATDLAGNMSQDSITVRGILDVNDEPELRCHGFIPTLIGTNGDDSIMGTDGSDVIVGLDGNDILIGLDGRDYICGGPGNDTIVGGRGNDRLHGEAGNDTIAGQEGDDELVGDGGEDILSGGPGMDDIMCGTEFDAVDGGSDTDQIAADCEYVVNNASSGNSAEPETPCTDVTPTIVGTNGDDVLVGTNGDDVISGRGGNDILIGLDGRDRLCGGEGDDVLIGGLERDHLNGGPGNDLLNGGQGQDHLLGERGFDMLYGGNDDDHIKCGNGEDFANGSLGVDTTDGTCETTIGIP
jgi:Ca2+-binding RTX toxin-like protein